MSMAVTVTVGACSFSLDLGEALQCGDELCGAGWVCNASRQCVPRTDAGVCGDGVVNSIEECDDGDSRDDNACTNACKWATCGDGIVRLGVEDCEPTTASCDATCVLQTGYVWPGNGHVYEMTSGAPLEWGDASNVCVGEGPGRHLATLDLEYQTIHDMFATQAYWIGMTNFTVPGVMTWVTGEPVATLHWGAGQPDNALDNEHCVQERIAPMDWNDRNCNYTLPGLCERDTPVIRALDHHAYVVSWTLDDRDTSVVRCQEGHLALADLADDAERDAMLQLPYRGDFRVANTNGGSCQALRRASGGVSLVDVDCMTALPALCEAY